MKVLVILGHQRQGSFCHAVAQTAVEELHAAGHEVVFHDLYAEGFDPVLPHAQVPKDATLDPIVRRHVEETTAAEGYVVVHPNWWAMPPAVLKGWIDRVVRQGSAYDFAPEGVVGLWKGKRALVITTSNTPRDVEQKVYGDPLENLWKTCIFGFCGVENFVRRNFESMVLSTPEQRAGWLEETRRLVRRQFPREAAR
jgi:NAD(P)H dehydrogenase (quinone)